MGGFGTPGTTVNNGVAIWVDTLETGPQILVRSGTHPVGTPEGVTIYSFQDPVINDAGDVAFVGLTIPGIKVGRTQNGIWVGPDAENL